MFLDIGFTTIKEIGNDADHATADIIKAIKSGWIQGPTIVYAGKIIEQYGGQSRSVNREHVKTHDGDLKLENKEGQGTQFIIQLNA